MKQCENCGCLAGGQYCPDCLFGTPTIGLLLMMVREKSPAMADALLGAWKHNHFTDDFFAEILFAAL